MSTSPPVSVSTASQTAPEVDTGLVSLAILAAVHEKPLDIEQIRREYVEPGALSDRDVLLRVARREGFRHGM